MIRSDLLSFCLKFSFPVSPNPLFETCLDEARCPSNFGIQSRLVMGLPWWSGRIKKFYYESRKIKKLDLRMRFLDCEFTRVKFSSSSSSYLLVNKRSENGKSEKCLFGEYKRQSCLSALFLLPALVEYRVPSSPWLRAGKKRGYRIYECAIMKDLRKWQTSVRFSYWKGREVDTLWTQFFFLLPFKNNPRVLSVDNLVSWFCKWDLGPTRFWMTKG